MTDAITFPEGFAWGTATASYQIEGAVAEGGRGRSIWDTFAHTPGRTRSGDTGDVACDHYHRYADDVALMRELNVDTYRFSLAWPRLQPNGRGELNPEGVAFYDRLVDELLTAGIRPWVTLYHWDLPQALEDAGGWPVRDTALRFADYAAAVHARLADRVADWTTLNEPWCSAFLGYASGHHAPGIQDPAAAVRAAHHLMLGHGLAVEAMRSARPDLRYGITLNLYPTEAATDDPADLDAARRVDGQSNRLYLDPILAGRYPDDLLADLVPIAGGEHLRDGDDKQIALPLDVLGVNYYSRHVVRAARPDSDYTPNDAWVGAADIEKIRTGKPVTAMGWEIDDQGLYDILTRVARDYAAPPMYVTENGAAYPDAVGPDGRVHDQQRIDYLDGHFRAAHRAIADGVDLRGYFVWSLMDNFEWAWGYDRRFGIVHVDSATQQRTIKDSGRWFAEVARRNGLPA
ncbi:GH1 family beta-glucosidase [Pseudonocardia nigra]|uniref:GH1 family beta-glucosidase n=1 Tax=Pseudonocardia nigra TaxID=1921578 RepID=UPI0027E346CC|nr:GH1 family beta-glucosidase [Pseudonocardia nigra]